ncbi:hypothetical protein AVEN_202069-1 [Araneus ventricosus]|uniref:Uncharacterized protein n=1 Tax=Araneus ventricosus TaxID=182803 RepID=A0A4Y2K088_ARAVE|nr:hypothetical protein AVEN_202069-1 [Araneus ventricosus]
MDVTSTYPRLRSIISDVDVRFLKLDGDAGKLAECARRKKSTGGKKRKKSSKADQETSPHREACPTLDELKAKKELCGDEEEYTNALFDAIADGPDEGMTIEMARGYMGRNHFDIREVELGLETLLMDGRIFHLGRRWISTEGEQLRLPTYLALKMERFMKTTNGRGVSYSEIKGAVGTKDDALLRGEIIYQHFRGYIYVDVAANKIYEDD